MATNHLWAVVLAGGEGSRLAALTDALYGSRIPKQFAALTSDKTLLQETMARIAPLVPPERTVVVVPATFEELASQQLRPFRGVEIVAQPDNRGTAAGLLLPLGHAWVRDPRAHVAIFPSDHYVRHDEAFLDAVAESVACDGQSRSGIALVGNEAEHAATDMGWIVASAPRRATGVSEVDTFVEKPDAEHADLLYRAGALWNTFVMTGKAQAFWALARQHVEPVCQLLEGYLFAGPRSLAPDRLAAIYESMPIADFSRDVLRAARGLGVVTMEGAGWSDCGTPARLVECLEGTEGLRRLRQRLMVRAPARPAAGAEKLGAGAFSAA
jgi:mannose-1-phosphate guanylyltransferase